MPLTARREFLKALGAGAAGLVLPSFARGAQARSASEKRPPNIVLIFADDLGWMDTGFGGSDFYETPYLDQLAREGVVFSAAYAAAGNCAPSRACLISGQYTPRHEVYAVDDTNRAPVNSMRMIPIPNKKSLPPDSATVAEALRAAGYATGHFGKWHLGNAKSPGTMPRDRGFDVSMDVSQSGSGAREDPKGIFAITRAACEFMENNKEKPFFAYVAHHAIHVGIQYRQASLDRFSAKDPGQRHSDAEYAASVCDLDAGVGLLLEKLEELGLEDNTLVVFTSDNGGTQQSSQAPLRGFKGMYYEGGIREPMIARWPGVTQPGTVCDAPVINLDLYPTFLEAAGSSAPEGKTLDGASIVPLLRGETRLAREAIFWHFPGYLDIRAKPTTVIRKGDWKLHLHHEEWLLDGGREKIDSNNAVELYNLADDIGERNNLAAANPAKRDELLDDLLAWIEATGAKMPSETNPEYVPGSSSWQGGARREARNAREAARQEQ